MYFCWCHFQFSSCNLYILKKSWSSNRQTVRFTVTLFPRQWQVSVNSLGPITGLGDSCDTKALLTGAGPRSAESCDFDRPVSLWVSRLWVSSQHFSLTTLGESRPPHGAVLPHLPVLCHGPQPGQPPETGSTRGPGNIGDMRLVFSRDA